MQPVQQPQQPTGSFAVGAATLASAFDPSTVAAPPRLPTNLSQAPISTTFPSTLGEWYGYENADSRAALRDPSAMYGGGVPAQSVQHTGASTTTNPQSFQALELGHMFSTQSMMYDQVLSNLSASLSGDAQQASGTSNGSSSGQFTQQPQHEQPRMDTSGSGSNADMSPDSFHDLLASFGEDYGAIFPDFNDGTLNFSTWSNVPQGFGYVSDNAHKYWSRY